jgi:hypothetical protein
MEEGDYMSGNWAAGFLRSQLSDKDGSVSNTRVLQCLIICHVLGWVSALLFFYGTITYKTLGTISMTDVVTFVGALGTFTTMLIGTLGLIKGGTDIANNRAPNAQDQVQPPDQSK